MEIISTSTSPSMNLKRYWRRKRYERLKFSRPGHYYYYNTKKMKHRVTRLGPRSTRIVTGTTTFRFWKIARMTKLVRIKKLVKTAFSPLKLLLAKLHAAYVDMMIRLANYNSVGKKGCHYRTRPASTVGSSRGDEVDFMLVLEIYKRLVASRELALLPTTSIS